MDTVTVMLPSLLFQVAAFLGAVGQTLHEVAVDGKSRERERGVAA